MQKEPAVDLDCEKIALGIVEKENQSSARKYDIGSLSAIPRPKFKEDVADAVSVYSLRGIPPNGDVILIISNRNYPETVDDAIKKSSLASTLLDPSVAKNVLASISDGYSEGARYVFWPKKTPVSQNKYIRKLQTIATQKSVAMWISDVGRTSKRRIEAADDINDYFLEPLNYLLAEAKMPDHIKSIARNSIEKIEIKNFHPDVVVQHGDFWHGNILLEKNWPLSLSSFYVIDWAGMVPNGYPFIDMLRYSLSVNTKPSRFRKYIEKYCAACNVKPEHILFYVNSYSGFLGLNRGKFPFERYLQSIELLHREAESLV